MLMWFLRISVLTTVVGFAIASLLFVRSSQRSVILVAAADLPVVDLEDWHKKIGSLPAGASRQVLHCVDNKHYIQPVIELESGKVGIPDPPYRLVVQDTGPLSRPQFLGCGDY